MIKSVGGGTQTLVGSADNGQEQRGLAQQRGPEKSPAFADNADSSGIAKYPDTLTFPDYPHNSD